MLGFSAMWENLRVLHRHPLPEKTSLQSLLNADLLAGHKLMTHSQ